MLIPIQPRPSAETSSPLFPSIRFFISSPVVTSILGKAVQSTDRGLVGFRAAGGIRGSLGLSPILRWHALPGTEGPRERVRIFVTEKVCGFRQFEYRIAEVIPGHLVSSLIQDPLIVGACILQTALQRAGTHVKIL